MKTLVIAAALAVFAAGAAPIAAGAAGPTMQQEKMKACGAKWTELKAKNQTGNQTYKDYSTKCMGSAADKPAKPASQQDKMKACGSEWSAMKAKGTTGKQTYADFSKTCLAKQG